MHQDLLLRLQDELQRIFYIVEDVFVADDHNLHY